jgi:tetratricopeptide (TPR) repeat protein
MTQRILSCVVTASVAVAFSGAARGAGKYTKKEAEIAATQTALTKPSQKKVEDKTRPEISADDVFQGVGEKVKSITDAQIKTMQRLIKNTSDSDPEKPDLLFRLAELYAEQQRYFNFRARELDEKIFTAQNNNDNATADKMKGQQADYQKKEQQWLLASVKQYLEVADHPEKYGKYKKMDEVLFYLAYLLTQVKKEDAARKYFKRLIKDYPKSKFIPDALLSFGEYFFEQKDLESALKFYERVLAYPDSRVFGYAKYKMGWVYYNLGDFKQAMATFIAVIELTEKGGGSSIKQNRIALQKEAKKDVVRTFARLPGAQPEKAWPFFQKVGKEYAPTMMEQLGELYNGQGMFADSIKVYRQLMANDPKSPKLCIWQTEVMRNTLSMTGSRATPDTVKELQRLAAVYDKVKAEKGLKKEALEECRDHTANTLRELATVWHKEAQKTNDQGTYALAQYLYKEYLQKFPGEKDAYTMTYYYAELLFKLGSLGDNQKYCEAGPIFTQVVEMDPKPDSKHLKESAYAAVISWKNCLSVEDSAEDVASARSDKRKEGKGASKDDGEKFAEQKIPDRQQQMLKAFDTYIKYVPDSKELPTIKYRKARIYYEYNHFDEAIPLFRDLADKHRDSDLAIYSANLLIDCLAIKKNFSEIKATAERYVEVAEFQKDPDFIKTMKVILAGIKRKAAEQLETDKKWKAAAQAYLEIVAENPNDPKVDEILFNIGVLFERANLIGLAIKAREQLIQTKPDSTNAKRAIYLIGKNFQQVAAFENSAEKYEQFASKYPGEKEASTALYTASFFRRGLGENDLALKDTDLFVKNYGGRKEFIDKAAGVDFSRFQIYEQRKDNDALKKHFVKYLKDWATKGGIDRQIVAHARLGEIIWRESCPVKGVNGACIDVIRTRAGGAARLESQKKKDKDKKKRKKKGADLPPQCGPETKSKIVVHERKPALVKEAMAHFAEALKLYKGGAAEKNVPGKDEAERSARIAEMHYYAAMSRMMQGDQEYEKFLGIRIPDKLDFSPPPPDASPAKQKAFKAKAEESKKKFKGYLDGKGKQLAAAQKVYQQVILFKQAHWAIAAAARIGQLFQDYSGQLFTAPVPKAGPSPVPGLPLDEWEQMFHDAYCDQMVDTAEPLEAKAIEGLGTCLGKSTELSWFNEWSGLCEAELNQIKPAEYPLASELRAEPGYFSVSADQAMVQSLERKE